MNNEEKREIIISQLENFEQVSYAYRPFDNEYWKAKFELEIQLEEKYDCKINTTFDYEIKFL